MSVDGLTYARSVADAVLYEGYLLYPYRATSSKNQSRWQFGVLGPPGAAAAGYGEDPRLSTQLLVWAAGTATTISVWLRFLHLQSRVPQRDTGDGKFVDVDELRAEVDGSEQRWLRWDEAVEHEPEPLTWSLADLDGGRRESVDVVGEENVEQLTEQARLVRHRQPLRAAVDVSAQQLEGGLARVSISVENLTDDAAADPATAIAHSLIGAHLLVSITDGEFVSMTDPPPEAATAAAESRQRRCWPVLAGRDGDRSLMLVSPIILYDHPEIAEQSVGSLFDATEIDEILTLRVMTMTDEEKSAARATDARAAEIIDRCDALSPEAMQAMHGVLRNPHAAAGAAIQAVGRVPAEPFLAGPPDAFGNDLSATFGFAGEVPWWDPAVDGSVDPFSDSVTVQGVEITAGSLVRLRPSHRADAHDIFFIGQVARVAAVHTDVDGGTYIAVILVDDPAADLYEKSGRYLHFAPDEIEPMPSDPSASRSDRKESRS
ncbi:MAG: hypothetical protein ABI345_09965 [Jatrophihabitans sp.]